MFALRSETHCASSSTSVHRYPDLHFGCQNDSASQADCLVMTNCLPA